MNLLLIELSQLDYKEDVFLALQSVGITKASAFDAKNLNSSLESEFSLFTGFLQSRTDKEGEKLVILAPIDSVEVAKELLSNLEAGGIPIKKEDILNLMVVPASLAFDQATGLNE
jgi:hypothetical protein